MAIDRRGNMGADANPLAFVVSEQDKQTMLMVQEALQRGRVRLAYQPVVLASDPSRTAFWEALVRVLDDKGRVIPAKDFMGAVETQELGRMIDCAALELGLQALARYTDVRIAVWGKGTWDALAAL